MKRTLIVTFTLIFAIVLGTLSVSAEAPTYNLVTEDAAWLCIPDQGATCKVEWVDGNAVFSGSTAGNWPNMTAKFSGDEVITVKIDDYSLVYDFTVEGGNTNISFFFSEGEHTFPLSNTSMGTPTVDPGSGDLCPATYTGKIALNDFVNSTAFLGDAMFDIALISDNNEISFHGIQVFSVNGGIITIREMKLVPNEGVDYSNESSDAESSDAESTASSEAESTSAPVEDSNGEDNGGDNSANIILWVVVGIAVVAVIAAVAVVIVKKKK